MDNQHLLDILQAHGESFLNSFDFPVSRGASKNREDVLDPLSPSSLSSSKSNEWEDEWTGISRDFGDSGQGSQECDLTHSGIGDAAGVILFQDAYKAPERSNATKAQMKAFMSAKVSRLQQDIPQLPAIDNAQEQEDYTNAQNDAALHRLIHNQLLSGSLSSDLEMSPAQRRKALAGRVLELSGAVKMGRGEDFIRKTERNKASKRVRIGLIGKQKERDQQELEEAKALGNYHPTIKKQFQKANSYSSKKRARGLKMGVGKFSQGSLRLSSHEINQVEGRRL